MFTSMESTTTTTCSTGNGLRKVFDIIYGFATPWRRNSEPRGRRVFHRDVEREEFPYGNTHCLSSYYSVFVARLAIMVMLAILIGLLTILTWHFTRIYMAKSLSSLAYGLRHELLQRPILRMWNILNSTAEITTAQVKLSEYVLRRYNNPTSQADQVELYESMKKVTWALFASGKALNAITINYRNGFVQAFHRDHKSDSTFYIYSDLSNYSISAVGVEAYSTDTLRPHQAWDDQSIHGNMSAIWYREPLDPVSGDKIGKAKKILPEDLINIAGLSQVPDGVATWHVAVSKYTSSPMLSAALPVMDVANKSIVAVVGVTTALSGLGQLMKELVEFHSGHIYLTSQEGFLLATSTDTPLLRNCSDGPRLKMAMESDDDVIRMGAEWLQRKYGSDFPPSHEVHIENAELGRHQYYIDSFFLKLKRLPLVGVVIIPRKYIMGKVDERALKTLVILISASLGILVIGCICIFILTNGVSKEMKLRAELISHLDARRRAEASSNYKSQFLANMSHELRTPMAAVIGLLDILICDDLLTNEQYATVTQIRKCSTALLRLLNNILDLSKVESGKLVLEEAEFDLGRELEGLVDMFSVQCINHNVETVLDLADDMPKLVQGDSARVVQVFVNLISNSIKFTTSGHVVLRGWSQNLNTVSNKGKFPIEQKRQWCGNKMKLRHQSNQAKEAHKKDNKKILWFEVDDTGCGIDPSKWESVFESFEQADPSTTRTHGGTGLGLCIVRTLVNKMGGEIKVVKKNGPGTLMQLYLVLNTPADNTEQHCQIDFAKHDLVVLLALHGSMGRLIMSQWLRKNGVFNVPASEWNELTQILRELFHGRNSIHNRGFEGQFSLNDNLRADLLNINKMRNPYFLIVVDIALLDLSTDIWKEQLNFLDKYSGNAKFAWMLNHDTSNAIKMELRRKGHVLMVNKPLYKAKIIQILEAVIKERSLDAQKRGSSALRNAAREGDLHECLEIDSTQFETGSSDESDLSELGSSNKPANPFQIEEEQRERMANLQSSKYHTVKNCLVELTHAYPDESGNLGKKEQEHTAQKLASTEPSQPKNATPPEQQHQGNSFSTRANVNEHKSLKGLRILIAEDTPVLQRVATIMLEKMGATVTAVGDGLQAVDALNCSIISPDDGDKNGCESCSKDSSTSPFDLILMDCQMPKMDGYEATKAIRKSEEGTELHIPIVALTAHAMSCDETKCLEVGMDAYLTKPIDYKLMVSTILSLTKTL